MPSYMGYSYALAIAKDEDLATLYEASVFSFVLFSLLIAAGV